MTTPENDVAQHPCDDVEAAWNAELTQRLEEIENGTAGGEPADEVFSELRAKYS